MSSILVLGTNAMIHVGLQRESKIYHGEINEGFLNKLYRMSPNIGSQEGEKLLLLGMEKEKGKGKRSQQ